MAGRIASAAGIKKNIHRCKHTDETDETGFVGFGGVLRRTKTDFRSPILAALRFISLMAGTGTGLHGRAPLPHRGRLSCMAERCSRVRPPSLHLQRAFAFGAGWCGRGGQGIGLLLFPACLHGRSSRPHSQAERRLRGKPGLFRPAVMLWCARQESNLNLRLRRPPFYPLNYGRAVYPESRMLRMRSGERQVVSVRVQALFLRGLRAHISSCFVVPSLADS